MQNVIERNSSSVFGEKNNFDSNICKRSSISCLNSIYGMQYILAYSRQINKNSLKFPKNKTLRKPLLLEKELKITNYN